METKTYIRPLLLISMILLLFCSGLNAGTEKEKKKEKNPSKTLATDGPYVLWKSKETARVITVDPAGKIHDTLYHCTLSQPLSLPVYSHHGKRLFNVRLHPFTRQPAKMKQAEKLFVLSDPHGNLNCMSELLQTNGVMDEHYHWSFGTNQLVIIGDVFDRGKEVLPLLWLIYKLEEEAENVGGQVIFLLGNHETMVLSGDDRYSKSKYSNLAELLGMDYSALFGVNSELGRWLATRNTMQMVGRNLFVHAGLSKELYDQALPIAELNILISQALFLKKSQQKRHSKFSGLLYGDNGPLWYRGMVSNDEKYHPFNVQNLPQLMQRYAAERIIVGHTIFKNITTFYNGRVVAINVDNKKNQKEGRERAILIEGNNIYRVGGKGFSQKPLSLAEN